MNITKLKNRLGDKLQGLQENTEKRQVQTMTKKALATVNSNYIALTNNAIDIIRENLKQQPLSFQLFDIVKSPSGGATMFTVPGIAGDEMYKELTGIVLDYATPRAYWDTPDPVEGTPPVCYSHDSIISYEGKACSRCPFNDFGSKDGESNAKACKESVMIFLLRPDNIMPIIIRVPVSSKLIFQRYMTRLIGKMLPLSGVVTKITLAKTTNKTGQPYSLYNFETVSKLSSEEATQARNFGQQFMKMFNDADLEPIVQEAS
ncbi:hypothetical protein [Pectinatus brassicae]|uniref:Uncharacterized protein n=1 Tax=Pectinatus brassicae TaxID=862415 RepID=A0A840UU06_9FIRM|nr:hypothetical protein [Pectinatus brassicae]MBB5336433.1 hypothetical protein [Pectinatus brassicae]